MQKNLRQWFFPSRDIDDDRIEKKEKRKNKKILRSYWTRNWNLVVTSNCVYYTDEKMLLFTEKLINLSLWLFLICQCPQDYSKGLLTSYVSLGILGPTWTHLNKSSSLEWYCLSYVNISMQKVKHIGAFLPEILMIKESCYMIGWRHFDQYLVMQNSSRYGEKQKIWY